MMNADLLWDGNVSSCTVEVDGDAVWIAADDLPAATGWTHEPHGLCRGDICVPTAGRDDLERNGSINVIAAMSQAAQPVATWTSDDRAVIAIGHAVNERHAEMAGTTAPDFTLPGRDGTDVRLDDGTHKKRLLLAFASW